MWTTHSFSASASPKVTIFDFGQRSARFTTRFMCALCFYDDQMIQFDWQFDSIWLHADLCWLHTLVEYADCTRWSSLAKSIGAANLSLSDLEATSSEDQESFGFRVGFQCWTFGKRGSLLTNQDSWRRKKDSGKQNKFCQLKNVYIVKISRSF